jgi:hypothetical protein
MMKLLFGCDRLGDFFGFAEAAERMLLGVRGLSLLCPERIGSARRN